MNLKLIEQLAKHINVGTDELKEAIENTESNLTLNVAKSFTDDEWNAYQENISKEKDAEYAKGKETGARQLVRDKKEELGLDFEGKDLDTLINKIREKAVEEVGGDVDERIKAKDKDLELLRTSSTQEIEALKGEINSINGKYNSMINDLEINKFIPEKLNGVSKRDAMTIIKSEFEFLNEDGQNVVKKNGEVIKDKARNPISWEVAIKDSLLERNWLDNGEGRGEGKKRSKTTGFNSMSELHEYFESNGINPKSQEANAKLQEVVKENKEFDFSN
jgi:hypothetical protein